MMNVNDYIVDNSDLFRQYKVDDMLFVEYICLAEDEISHFWAHNNSFIYTLQGKKGIKSLDREYYIEAGDALFVKKGAHTSLQFFEERYYALLIYLSDEFINSVMQQLQVKDSASENTDEQPTLFSLEVDDILAAYFYSVLSYFSQSKGPSRQLLKKKFEELIINVLSSPKNRPLAGYFKDLYANGKTSLREVMETNFPYNLKMIKKGGNYE